jgi:hypothetical protein
MMRIRIIRGVKGWRKPQGAKYVTRGTRWGNPFDWRKVGRAASVELFRQYLAEMAPSERESFIAPLREATALCCYCKPTEPCHADVLIAEALR